MIGFVCVGVVFAAFLTALATFDSLLKIERSEHVDAWIGDGSPTGFFYWPLGGKSAGTVSGSSSRGQLLTSWVHATPTWAISDRRARGLLRRLRVCMALWFIGAPATAALWAWIRR